MTLNGLAVRKRLPGLPSKKHIKLRCAEYKKWFTKRLGILNREVMYGDFTTILQRNDERLIESMITDIPF